MNIFFRRKRSRNQDKIRHLFNVTYSQQTTLDEHSYCPAETNQIGKNQLKLSFKRNVLINTVWQLRSMFEWVSLPKQFHTTSTSEKPMSMTPHKNVNPENLDTNPKILFADVILDFYICTIQGLYSLRRRRLTGIGTPMINLTRSDDRLRFIMGIPILIFLVNRGPYVIFVRTNIVLWCP